VSFRPWPVTFRITPPETGEGAVEDAPDEGETTKGGAEGAPVGRHAAPDVTAERDE
jgi:hypothetical protein